ncbi:MAG: structural protein [Bacteriophage sp.]|nr:MAG: structural protein [Bacteriophage sp.]
MKILNNFADNFQKGGIPFLIFIGVVGYLIFKMLERLLPDALSVDEKAKKEVIDAVGNQTGVKDNITTQDKIVASKLHSALDGFFKDTTAMEECLQYFTSALITKRVYVAYGTRDHSILWFSSVKMNLVEAISKKYIGTDVAKKFTKVFKNANLS